MEAKECIRSGHTMIEAESPSFYQVAMRSKALNLVHVLDSAAAATTTAPVVVSPMRLWIHVLHVLL